MKRAELATWLKKMVCEILEIEEEELKDDVSLVEEYQIDSLNLLEIMSKIEKEFKFDVEEGDLTEQTTFQEIIIYIESKTALT